MEEEKSFIDFLRKINQWKGFISDTDLFWLYTKVNPEFQFCSCKLKVNFLSVKKMCLTIRLPVLSFIMYYKMKNCAIKTQIK